MKGKPLASIVSAGLSKFGRLEGLYAREIFALAAKEAFDARGLPFKYEPPRLWWSLEIIEKQIILINLTIFSFTSPSPYHYEGKKGYARDQYSYQCFIEAESFRKLHICRLEIPA